MPKFEPMSVEEISELIDRISWTGLANPISLNYCTARLILAWAHERAEKNRAEHPDTCEQCITAYHDKDHCPRYHWEHFSDWLNEVLDEIGWPEEQR
jgi:hypothetical protein